MISERLIIRITNTTIQVTGWAFFILYPILNRPEQFQKPLFLTDYCIRHLLFILFFYFNYFYLIPVSLKKKGVKIYFIHVIILFLAFFVLSNISDQLIIPRPFYKISFISFVALIQLFAISTTLRMIIDYIMESRAKKELENDKRTAELAFLRSQINPHFLFNTLNNINSLISKDPEKAEETVIKLSHLMRYVLNASSLDKVLLKDEIEYIKNFIDLQKIRLPIDFKLKVEIEGEITDVEIEPLLLIGLIENPFKHALSGLDTDYIHIRIQCRDNQLLLDIKNSSHMRKNKMIDSGVGIENIRKRLNLLYLEKYKLSMIENENDFSVELILYL